MEAFLLIILVTAVVVALAALVGTRRRGDLFEQPPSQPGAPGQGAPPAPAVEKAPPDQPAPVGEPVDVDEHLAAQVEEALAPVWAAPVEAAPLEAAPLEAAPLEAAPLEAAPLVKPRFRDRLAKARSTVSGHLVAIRSRSRIDPQTWEDLEEALIRADVGVAAVREILARLAARVSEAGITSPDALLEELKSLLKADLAAGDRSLRFEPGGPNVWLFVGVNGVGKTTTIGKVGKAQAAAGRSVVMAAGDTFRAAAADQLAVWAQRAGADLVRGSEGGDPSSVIFDAVQRAAARGADLVLADTAGRLHTKVNLMEELRKVRRVADRPPGKVTEVLLVLDATTGQNGLVQAQQFTEAVDLTGVVLTKLDGSAKGGIAVAIQSSLGIPIKLAGLGESAHDLVEFDPGEFVDALFE